MRPPLGLSELNLHKDSASSSYLERERLSSHYAARGPGALRSWTPQVLTLLRRQSVGKGPHQAPKLVGVGVGGGKKEKAPSKCMPLTPGQQRTASGQQHWELGGGGSLLAAWRALPETSSHALNSGAPRPISLTYFKPLWVQSSPGAL